MTANDDYRRRFNALKEHLLGLPDDEFLVEFERMTQKIVRGYAKFPTSVLLNLRQAIDREDAGGNQLISHQLQRLRDGMDAELSKRLGVM